MAANYITNVETLSGTDEAEVLMVSNNHAGLFQVTFGSGATGTVTLYGKLTAAHDYFELEELTASGMSEIAICPFMKISWALSGGTAEATIMETM